MPQKSQKEILPQEAQKSQKLIPERMRGGMQSPWIYFSLMCFLRLLWRHVFFQDYCVFRGFLRPISGIFFAAASLPRNVKTHERETMVHRPSLVR